MLTNTPTRIGLATRFLHWGMAITILGMLPFGHQLARLEPALSTLWLYGLHKSIGITVLAALLLRIFWHWLTPPPGPITQDKHTANRLAKGVHRAFYLLVLVVPLSGWIASSASGLDTILFNRVTLPAIAPTSPAIEDAGFFIHRWSARLLAAFLILHIAGALSRRDGTLRRMVLGRAAP